MKSHFMQTAKNQPIENCLTIGQLNERIDEMERTISHDALPALYDRFVAVRNELQEDAILAKRGGSKW